jgi:hypothetical protein
MVCPISLNFLMIGDEVCKEKANENENYRIDKAGVGDKC